MHDVLYYLAQEDLADLVLFFAREGGHVEICVNCNDMFWWATADCEEITPGNLPILKQAVEDCRAIDKFCWFYGLDLFACRVRNMRPQDAAYPDDKRFWSLFDAAGPPRDSFDNPFPREAYWQRRQERKQTELEKLRDENAELKKQLAQRPSDKELESRQ